MQNDTKCHPERNEEPTNKLYPVILSKAKNLHKVQANKICTHR